MSWQKVGGQGLWTEYENTETGEKSLKTHKLKVVKKWCNPNKHNYVVVDMPQRTAQCMICGKETTFIVGKDRIENGKVILG